MIARFIGRVVLALAALSLTAAPVMAQMAYLPQYNATLPTVGDGGNVSLQADSRGRLIVSSSSGDANGLAIQGPVANDGVSIANPILNGCYASTAIPAAVSADGDIVHTWCSRLGAQVTELVGTNNAFLTSFAAAGDSVSNTANSLAVSTFGYGFNGSTWDRVRSGGNSTDGLATSAIGIPTELGFNFIFNGATWDRLKKPNSTSRIPSAAATTNATVAKASAGDVFDITAMNTTASVVFLKLYNKATSPTVGTDTPVLTIALPPTNASFALDIDPPLYMSAGISYAITANAADSDTTAVAAGAVVGLNIAFQ